VRRGSEADEQEPCSRISEAWYRLSPVGRLFKSTGLFYGDAFPPGHQTRAEMAPDDTSLKSFEVSHRLVVGGGTYLTRLRNVSR
jgi:hypothetical protein